MYEKVVVAKLTYTLKQGILLADIFTLTKASIH